jgi:hypothetical protein
VIKRYVEFFYRGIIIDETTTHEVGHSDPNQITVPRGAFAFRFFNIVEMPAVGRKGVTLRSDGIDFSKKYYVGGRVMTLADVEREMPSDTGLIRNMRNNGFERVIRTSQGNFQPFDKDCVLLSDNQVCKIKK